MKNKTIDRYVWRGDETMQYRVSYIPQRGGVEVVDPNGDTKREKDCSSVKEAKVIIAEFERQIKANEI